MIRRLTVWQPWLTTAARLFLAGVWFWSGWPKLIDGAGTVRSVRAFQLLPEVFVHPFGYAMPIVELALGVLLLLGLFTRWAALATAAMMVMYIGGIISVWARGLSIDCGCFGSTGLTPKDPVPGYIWDTIRDTGLLLLALAVARWPRGVVDTDRLLGLTVPPEEVALKG